MSAVGQKEMRRKSATCVERDLSELPMSASTIVIKLMMALFRAAVKNKIS